MRKNLYQVIVVGGGHAGCEAALAAARMGKATLMITGALNRIAAMSCNPAVGGLAKGHLVREIDALGGEMGRAIDATAIQFRLLNSSKGPAVQAYRAQADRWLYQARMQRVVEEQARLDLHQDEVVKIITKGCRVAGVETAAGDHFSAETVVICSGTFLNGLMHIGMTATPGGREGDAAATALTTSLHSLGFTSGRLKTGTCPRLDSDTIDYSKVEEQPGDSDMKYFSHWPEGERLEQRSCYITYTNRETQRVIEKNLDRSPLYTGIIDGVGPRYCPSIEDKVKRFPQKERHQIFLEPEGLTTDEVYPNGLSTSLPADVQLQFLRTIAGLEKVEIVRPGYAIEYDFFSPTQIYPTLETKLVEGLFFAGQINGTSGYEEAAAQGLVAGMNAALKVAGSDELLFARQNSYIGVLIDDLVTKGTEEPYRMFTSRAEFRLLLRQDNADQRLCKIGYEAGLLGADRYDLFCAKMGRIENEVARLKKERLTFEAAKGFEELTGGSIPKDGILYYDLLKRPRVTVENVPGYQFSADLLHEERQQIAIAITYEGYIARQMKLHQKALDAESHSIPDDIDYSALHGLSLEVVEKLSQIRPASLGQASRIAGVTPAAVSILHVHLTIRSKGAVR